MFFLELARGGEKGDRGTWNLSGVSVDKLELVESAVKESSADVCPDNL
jgi:hypothetical protein